MYTVQSTCLFPNYIGISCYLLHLNEKCHVKSELLPMLQGHVAERVVLASPAKQVSLGILVPRVSLDPKVSQEFRDLKDRLGKLETKAHGDQLDR